MNGIVRQVWLAARPMTGQQRFLWWCGSLLLMSGVAHFAVAAVDGTSWWGPVSWRKPALFGMSFGVLLVSMAWVMRQLPTRRWGWLPAGLLGAASVVEVALITMQRWRGVPSHFYAVSSFDAAVWSAMAISVAVVVLAIVLLLLWSLAQFQGDAVARVAVVAGLLGVLAAGAIGSDMASTGEAVVATTGQVPLEVVFGAAGSAKLAHAIGLHGLQLLGLLAIVLGLGRLPTRSRLGVMGLAVGGYASVFAAVTVTAYAGRAWTAPTTPIALLALVGALAVLVAGLVAARHLWSGHREAVPAGALGRARRRRAGVVR